MAFRRINIQDLAAEYGVNNLRFFIPMRKSMSLLAFGLPMGMSSSDTEPTQLVECTVNEKRYKVSEGYKIQFSPVNRGDGEPFYYADQSYYQSDFGGIMAKNPDSYRIYVLVDEDNKYERLRF
jgi:hypothetical protein